MLTAAQLAARRRSFLWGGLLFMLLLEPLRFAPVQGASMEPTLREGDLLCFQRLEPSKLPERGRLVVFEAPTRSGKLFVKRLIGLPGDEIRFEDGELFVNGQLLALPPEALEAGFWLSTRVPASHFFAMGDHASVSFDSRRFGPVHLDRLVGQVVGF